MSNTTDIIGTILMLLGSLIAISFIIYLRWKTYAIKQTKVANILSMSYEFNFNTEVEILNSTPNIHKPRTKDTLNVKHKQGSYTFDIPYEKLLNGCF